MHLTAQECNYSPGGNHRWGVILCLRVCFLSAIACVCLQDVAVVVPMPAKAAAEAAASDSFSALVLGLQPPM